MFTMLCTVFTGITYVYMYRLTGERKCITTGTENISYTVLILLYGYIIKFHYKMWCTNKMENMFDISLGLKQGDPL